MNKPPRKRNKATSASCSEDTPSDNQDFEENPATATITVTAVEIPELTEQEISDRLHLERKVERAFFEAGKALAELRDRKLYRSTHKTFEEYCKQRFGYTRIAASAISLREVKYITFPLINSMIKSLLTKKNKNAMYGLLKKQSH